MTLHLGRIRASLPAVDDQAYLQSAGASLTPSLVVQATRDTLDQEAAVGG